MTRTTISLPGDLADRLGREARRRDTSASAIVRDALNEHFGPVEGKREIPFAALGSSGSTDTAQRMEELMDEEGFGEDSLGS